MGFAHTHDLHPDLTKKQLDASLSKIINALYKCIAPLPPSATPPALDAKIQLLGNPIFTPIKQPVDDEALPVADRVDFGRKSTSGATETVISTPFLLSWFVGQQRLNHAPFEVGQVISAHAEPKSELVVKCKSIRQLALLA